MLGVIEAIGGAIGQKSGVIGPIGRESEVGQ